MQNGGRVGLSKDRKLRVLVIVAYLPYLLRSLLVGADFAKQLLLNAPVNWLSLLVLHIAPFGFFLFLLWAVNHERVLVTLDSLRRRPAFAALGWVLLLVLAVAGTLFLLPDDLRLQHGAQAVWMVIVVGLAVWWVPREQEIWLLWLALGFLFLGIACVFVASPEADVVPNLMPDRSDFNSNFYPDHIFNVVLPIPNIPTLQEIAGDALTDDEIVTRVVEFYEENEAMIREGFHETHPDRLKALFSMYIIHISHTYNYTEPVNSFVEYVQERTTSHCGLMARYQTLLVEGFGLKWRRVGMPPGTHTWLEVMIDGQWEIFDATINIWINRSALELLEQSPRQYRTFYMPWMDPDNPEARNYAEVEGVFDVEDGKIPFFDSGPAALRERMAGLGIFWPEREDYFEVYGPLQIVDQLK